MPPMNRRPRSSYRPSSRPSAPSYNRRTNSMRRDIQMNNKRRRSNSPNWKPILLVIAILAVAILIITVIINSKNKPSSNPSPTESIKATENKTPVVNVPTVDSTLANTQGGLIYTDDRVPNYSGQNPVWESIKFEWERQDNRGTMQIDISIDKEMYIYYRNLGRYYGVDNYHHYVNDSNNNALISKIAKTIKDIANTHSYSDAAVVREVAKFVQDVIEYQYDSDTTGEDEYPRYPIETLYEQQGDCEDTSILMAALLKELGYDVGFLHLPGHLAVALRTADNYSGGTYYEINGHRYLYIESTGSGWNIGDIPDDVMGQQATFYAIP